MIKYLICLMLLFNSIGGVFGQTANKKLSDEVLMTLVQKQTFRYFWDYAHPKSGLARERSNGEDDIVTIGGSGFGVMAIIVGVERGFVTREEGADRVLKIVQFLSNKETNSYHGMWPHWIDGKQAKLFLSVEKTMVQMW